MMDKDLGSIEMLSAMVDGELQDVQMAQAVEFAVNHEAGYQVWASYHLIGDVMRSPDLAAGHRGDAFLQRLRAGLSETDSSQAGKSHVAAPPLPKPVINVSTPPANDPIFRWKLVAGFASLIAVIAVSVQFGAAPGDAPAQTQIARAMPAIAQAASAPGAEPQVMLRDPRLDELLAAHRQSGGASALQMPSGFLRNATFEAAPRQANR